MRLEVDTRPSVGLSGVGGGQSLRDRDDVVAQQLGLELPLHRAVPIVEARRHTRGAARNGRRQRCLGKGDGPRRLRHRRGNARNHQNERPPAQPAGVEHAMDRHTSYPKL